MLSKISILNVLLIIDLLSRIGSTMTNDAKWAKILFSISVHMYIVHKFHCRHKKVM